MHWTFCFRRVSYNLTQPFLSNWCLYQTTKIISYWVTSHLMRFKHFIWPVSSHIPGGVVFVSKSFIFLTFQQNYCYKVYRIEWTTERKRTPIVKMLIFEWSTFLFLNLTRKKNQRLFTLIIQVYIWSTGVLTWVRISVFPASTDCPITQSGVDWSEKWTDQNKFRSSYLWRHVLTAGPGLTESIVRHNYHRAKPSRPFALHCAPFYFILYAHFLLKPLFYGECKHYT